MATMRRRRREKRKVYGVAGKKDCHPGPECRLWLMKKEHQPVIRGRKMTGSCSLFIVANVSLEP